MLKRFLPLLILVFFFLPAQAQVNKAKQYYNSGIKLKNNNQFSEALAAFHKATEFDKKFDSAYVEIGHIYSKAGKIDTALINYNKALAINSKYADALFGMGKLYRDAIKKYDSAIYYFDAASKIDSTNKEIFYGLAWIYNARKEHDVAISYAIKSLEIDNTYKPAYGELGHAYRATKKYAECIEQLKKNLAVSVVDVAYLYSGYCYTELNNKEGAVQQYEALKKINERMAAALKKKIDAMPAPLPGSN
ncbi:MAG: tetratricopeptide repeat protein [Chitinophagaceae bacterium]|nr:tetratricopeptide repeat protein [Chitinophagaceae bacterium]MBK9487171.1 tetratricopeptide repeat protein [Chitinophagaceae bacterium]